MSVYKLEHPKGDRRGLPNIKNEDIGENLYQH